MKLNKQEQQLITIQFLCKEMGYNPSFFYEHFFKIASLVGHDDRQINNIISWLKHRKEIIGQILIYALELGLIESIAYDTIKKNLLKLEPFIEKLGYIKPLPYLDLPELEGVYIRLKRMVIYTLQSFELKEVPEQSVSDDSSNLNSTKMKSISPEQLKCLNTLISKQGIPKDEKEAMVFGFSGGRATSSKDLFFSEAIEMIKHLKASDPNERMRKKVFALAREAGIIYGETSEDKKMNIVVLDAFLLKNGTIKKKLNAMSKEELVKVVSQFQQIAKHTGESKASKATKGMLAELNISTTTKRAKKTF